MTATELAVFLIWFVIKLRKRIGCEKVEQIRGSSQQAANDCRNVESHAA